MYRNFMEEGNVMLRCYNLFPRQFSDIPSMTAYLDQIAAMHFNAVWINPIQKSGGSVNEKMRIMDSKTGVWENNYVNKSLYAMDDDSEIDPCFSNEQDQTKHILDFTEKCKKLNLVPMFDLVLNHVAADSKICQKYPEWFYDDPYFKDVKRFNYEDEFKRKAIIKELWIPYLNKYLVTYGFDGVRVDAVAFLHPGLREEIYQEIEKICRENNKPKPVILDEMLCESMTDEVVKKLRTNSASPTHVLSSVYYADRDEYSAGLPNWVKNEAGEKASLVFVKQDGTIRDAIAGGAVNFSGNHDNFPLGLLVIRRLAIWRLLQDNEMKVIYEKYAKGNESRETKLLYPYIKDIEAEIENKNVETINSIERAIKDRLAICALSGGGGWYALCGDEYGDTCPKSVFTRANGEPMYAQQKHKKLINPDDATKNTLKKIALKLLQQDSGLYEAYQKMTDENIQSRILLPFIDNIILQINSGVREVCDEFQAMMQQEGVVVTFSTSDYISFSANAPLHWQGRFDLRSYISSINKIIANFPASKPCFWSELIALPEKPDLVVLVRKNGFGFGSPTDIAIVNINEDFVNYKISEKDIHAIACEFQKRTIPPENRFIGHPDFDAAYWCIMKAKLHLGDGVFKKENKTNPAGFFANVKSKKQKTTEAQDKMQFCTIV